MKTNTEVFGWGFTKETNGVVSVIPLTSSGDYTGNSFIQVIVDELANKEDVEELLWNCRVYGASEEYVFKWGD